MESDWLLSVTEPKRPSLPLGNTTHQTLISKALFEHAQRYQTIAAVALSSRSIQNSSLAPNLCSLIRLDQNSIKLFDCVFHPAFSRNETVQFTHSLYIVRSPRSIHENSTPSFFHSLKSTKYFDHSLRSLVIESPPSYLLINLLLLNSKRKDASDYLKRKTKTSDQYNSSDHQTLPRLKRLGLKDFPLDSLLEKGKEEEETQRQEVTLLNEWVSHLDSSSPSSLFEYQAPAFHHGSSRRSNNNNNNHHPQTLMVETISQLSFSTISSNSQQILTSLDFSNFENASLQSYQKLFGENHHVQNSPLRNLKTLIMRENERLQENDFALLKTICENSLISKSLTSLDISENHDFSDETLLLLAGLENLIKLDINTSDGVSDSGLENYCLKCPGGCSPLKSLNVMNCAGISFDSFSSSSSSTVENLFPRLENLEMGNTLDDDEYRGVFLEDETFENLAKLSNNKCLKSLSFESIRFESEWLEILASSSSSSSLLEELALIEIGSRISFEQFDRILPQFDKLRKLKVLHCKHLSSLKQVAEKGSERFKKFCFEQLDVLDFGFSDDDDDDDDECEECEEECEEEEEEEEEETE